jgi:cellulose synthase/poly-beta-1,6-N-acetylglucosamine synthase-like glycosyltransferase/GGDEF domain-containing protein
MTAGVVDPAEFAIELAAEFDRRSRGGRNCMVGTISIFEVPGLRHKYGSGYVFDRITEITGILQQHLAPIDIVTVAEDGEILIMARESRLPAAINRVERVCKAIAGRRFDEDGEGVLLTPSAGVATLDDGVDPADVVRRAVDAREVAAGHLDLRVHRWEPAMSADTAPEERQPFDRFNWQRIKERCRAPVQIMSTYVVGLLIPFCFYWSMANIVGFDVTWWVYLSVVFTLVLTGVMILVEAQLAVHQKEPPEVDEYPEATAIICAYLPNEAATIMGTLDAFLNNGYPGGLQIILAYNTPNSMPVERELARLAEEYPNLDIVRVEGSTSKAQNVNAVLAMARGAFTGMFDADHEPRPGSFERSWRWLANGYDVVQGHCLTRNGEETKLARMIAVEFESIYAVAHPGRAKLHRFGVFGGSNGYWRTDLLHETRMRGSMLTEDIDSSMRTVERGLKIRSDRDVVSRELGTTTFKQVWNQRLRWAQGWFQVTMMHTIRVWKSPGLTFRQKFGATYLLGYREVYPWLSLQIFPLVAYWLTRGDTLSYGWPIFLCTTLFVLHIGPIQTWYAYRLADWEIKQHKRWFIAYLFFSTLFYTEYKNTIARVAHIKEFVGERAWKVTPRSDAPIEFEDEDEHSDEHDGEHADAVSVAVVSDETIETERPGDATELVELPRSPEVGPPRGSPRPEPSSLPRAPKRTDELVGGASTAEPDEPTDTPDKGLVALPRRADRVGRTEPSVERVAESERLLRLQDARSIPDGRTQRPMLPRSTERVVPLTPRATERDIAARVRRLTDGSIRRASTGSGEAPLGDVLTPLPRSGSPAPSPELPTRPSVPGRDPEEGRQQLPRRSTTEPVPVPVNAELPRRQVARHADADADVDADVTRP